MIQSEKAKIIAIASGKGGTGKTTVAVNLAFFLAQENTPVTYLDCDVEEPNGHLFLKPSIQSSVSVGIPVPEVDKAKCDACGKCSEICQYSAIVCLASQVLVFPELCHGCGGCMLVCPTKAIREVDREIGVVETGISDTMRFGQGRLNIGQASAVPLIRAVKKLASGEGVFILDCPPGTSCPVIEAVRGADFTLLVTEPTPFGLNDLRLAVEMVRALRQPFGIIINRAGMGDGGVEEYCRNQDIDILISLPDDRKIAEAYSVGTMALAAMPEYRLHFENLFMRINKKVKS